MLFFFPRNFIMKFQPSFNWQRGFQTPASPLAEGIFSFHDDLRIFLVGILCFVIYILYSCLNRFAFSEEAKTGISHRLIHASTLEIIWTIIPAIILFIIAIPSFSLLYSIDEIHQDILFNVKVIGHQWYWSYEITDPEAIASLYNDTYLSPEVNYQVEGSSTFDSYRISDEELNHNQLRLLTVDNHLFIPTERYVRTRVTSADVLHSWAIPSLGVKLDACPGRLNQTTLYIKREGVFYGQCSEICGVNHGFRPIGIISKDFFSSLDFTKKAIDIEPLISTLQAIINE